MIQQKEGGIFTHGGQKEEESPSTIAQLRRRGER